MSPQAGRFASPAQTEAGAEWASRDCLRGEQLRLALGGKRIDNVVETFAVHDPVERIERQIDAMVGQPPLRKIIGADSLRPVAGADLGTPLLRPLGVQLLVSRVEDARAQE